MKIPVMLLVAAVSLAAAAPGAARSPEVDRIPTAGGDLEITFIGHGTLMFRFEDKVIHVDPYGKLMDYQKLPDADLILITHEHRDHLDMEAIKAIRTPQTVIVANPPSASRIEGAVAMKNGESKSFLGLAVQAVPAYNVVHKRDNAEPFHPPGRDNGYVITFADKRVYIAGDTENIEDMKSLGPIDVAFLPVNLPYTMTLEMASDAATMIAPRILYPYHYGDTPIKNIADLLKDSPEMEVRIRRMN